MLELLNRFDGGELLGLAGILGGVLIALIAIVMGVWHSMHATSHLNTLKREMLARGMSIHEIERLTMTEAERLARMESDRVAREAEIAGDLKREMIVRGVPVEQIRELTTGTTPQIEEEAKALADTIVRMVHDGELDRDAVARLIAMFMRRCATPRESVHVTANGG